MQKTSTAELSGLLSLTTCMKTENNVMYCQSFFLFSVMAHQLITSVTAKDIYCSIVRSIVSDYLHENWKQCHVLSVILSFSVMAHTSTYYKRNVIRHLLQNCQVYCLWLPAWKLKTMSCIVSHSLYLLYLYCIYTLV